MSLADELNRIGNYGYIQFSDLVIGQKYKVRALKCYDSALNGRDRTCLRVDIDAGYLILPERYDEKVKTISTANVDNLYIAYYGRKKGNYLDIHFIQQEEQGK